ncbi:hypothetical protein FKM82_031239 [Ascaphus truei]
MQGSLGCLMYVGVISSVLAILGFAAMVNGAVNLRPDQPFSYSWAFALGWISVIMAVTSAALSVYVSRVEPAAPIPEPQAEAGTATGTQTSSNPPGGVISPINRFIQMLSRKPTPPPS